MNTRALIEAEEDFHYDSVAIDNSMVVGLREEIPEWRWSLHHGDWYSPGQCFVGIIGVPPGDRATYQILIDDDPEGKPVVHVKLIVVGGAVRHSHSGIDSMDTLVAVIRDMLQNAHLL